MRRLAPLAGLLLATAAPAQLRVGTSSISFGDEVLFRSPGGQTGSREVGIGLGVSAVAPAGVAAELRGAMARFPATTCDGVQARLEWGLWQRVAAGTRGAKGRRSAVPSKLPDLDAAAFEALKLEDGLKSPPSDPASGGSYSFWNYRVDPAKSQVRCKVHGAFRDRLKRPAGR